MKFIRKNWLRLIIFTFLFGVISYVSYFGIYIKSNKKCPEDYVENNAGTAEYKDALISWTSEFFEAHPEATMSDWSMAKLKLWENNKCVVALQRSKMSGKMADLKPWELVDYAVQNAIEDMKKEII